ncbi:unnamed protein product [Dracunculus medinensis]|uniref:U3 small nucleolar RNA-associated protein 11 n=1 Tax=Dracunculus medinensis TaxID=318479 RepID=A0A0N4UFA2_DRAME|nr:unnamed protein product [Dracunculus medinensis]
MGKISKNKLDDALRTAATGKKVNVDKMLTSLSASFLKHSIVFVPSSISSNVSPDSNPRHILLKANSEKRLRSFTKTNKKSVRREEKALRIARFQEPNISAKKMNNSSEQRDIQYRKLKSKVTYKSKDGEIFAMKQMSFGENTNDMIRTRML